MRWIRHPLFAALLALSIVQTCAPIAGQKFSRGIVYHHLLDGAIALSVITAIVVTCHQALYRRFTTISLIGFYVGVALLVAFDVWIERLIGASC